MEEQTSGQYYLHLDVNQTRLPWDQIPFLLNISRDVPDHLGVVLFGCVFPFLLVLTLVTNLLIVWVLAQQHMRTPTNLVLLAMAIADLLTLLLPSPWYFYLYTLGHHREPIYPVPLCYMFHIMYEALPALFHTYSIWLTLLLAGQRYIYVCHFSMARTWCTVPRVFKTMMFILLLTTLHQLSRFFDRTFHSIEFEWNGQTSLGCEYLTSKWVHVYIGEDSYYIFYYGFRIIFVHIGPCVMLVVLNLLLFKALHQTQRTRERLFAPKQASGVVLTTINTPTTMTTVVINNNNNNNNDKDNNNGESNNNLELSFEQRETLNGENTEETDFGPERKVVAEVDSRLGAAVINNLASRSNYVNISKRDSNSTTIMLIVIVSVFLCLEIPLTITTILHVVQNTLAVELVDYNTLNTTVLVTNFFIILSYPINFAIYCGMSRQFRLTFAQIFLYNFSARRIFNFKFGQAQPIGGGGGGVGGGAAAGNGKRGRVVVGGGGGGGNERDGEDNGNTNIITSACSSTYGVTSRNFASVVLTNEGGEMCNLATGTSATAKDDHPNGHTPPARIHFQEVLETQL